MRNLLFSLTISIFILFGCVGGFRKIPADNAQLLISDSSSVAVSLLVAKAGTPISVKRHLFALDFLYDNYDLSTLKDDSVCLFMAEGIYFSKDILVVGEQMYSQGWRYFISMPKSSNAEWGILDERTTWWRGYWYNKTTRKYSESTPKKQTDGIYIGDNINNNKRWRNGGSPSAPTKIEWLLFFPM